MEILELTIAERGQIVIPKKARDELGLKPGVKIEMRVQGQTLVIQKSTKLDLSQWIGYARDKGTTAQQDLAQLRGRPVPWTGSADDQALLALPQAQALKQMAAAAKSGRSTTASKKSAIRARGTAK
jgi:AbrB family looped-hinge helix DNA binding protein